jgi:hypothetical protein
VRRSVRNVPDTVSNLLSPSGRKDMAAFFLANLGALRATTGSVLYPFGGPDAVYPMVLFPKLDWLVLIGTEKPGKLPDPQALRAAGARDELVATLGRLSLDVFRYSFFITSNMNRDLPDVGIAPLLAVQLVAQGHRIVDFQEISIGRDGAVAAPQAGSTAGVRFRFTKADGAPGEVLYLQQDLSNAGLAAHPEFRAFLSTQHFDTAYYKAASFASHQGEVADGQHEVVGGRFYDFSSLLMDRIPHLVQSDDGLSFDFVRTRIERSGQHWTARLFGVYTPPLKSEFKVDFEPGLRDFYGGAICAAQSRDAMDLWARVWGEPCHPADPIRGLSSVLWVGMIPFRYGYASISGPELLDWNARVDFGTLMVFDRVD